MRGTDRGDEHLNIKGAVCDLQNPEAVHLQRIDPITQKQATQTGNKTSSQGSLLLSDIQASCSNHGSLYLLSGRGPQHIEVSIETCYR